jgi:hypothetical protein
LKTALRGGMLVCLAWDVQAVVIADFGPEAKKMSGRHELYVIAGLGAIIALALILFPEWDGVHPGDGLSMPLGHAWISSPPLPPEHFTGLRVERSWSENIFIALGVLAIAAFWVALSPGKAK